MAVQDLCIENEQENSSQEFFVLLLGKPRLSTLAERLGQGRLYFRPGTSQNNIGLSYNIQLFPPVI